MMMQLKSDLGIYLKQKAVDKRSYVASFCLVSPASDYVSRFETR